MVQMEEFIVAAKKKILLSESTLSNLSYCYVFCPGRLPLEYIFVVNYNKDNSLPLNVNQTVSALTVIHDEWQSRL